MAPPAASTFESAEEQVASLDNGWNLHAAPQVTAGEMAKSDQMSVRFPATLSQQGSGRIEQQAWDPLSFCPVRGVFCV